MFENLTDKLERSFKILKGEGRITEINVAETLKEIRRALIDADVNYKVAKTFTDEVKQKALGQDVLKAVKPGQMMTKIVRDELAELMGGTATDIRLEGTPAVILIAGLQGSGKTTFSGKLASLLKSKKGRQVLLVAGDVYRPAAIDQLKVLGGQIGVVVYTEEELKYLQEDCKITLPDNLYITDKDAKKTCTVHTKEKLAEQNKPTEPTTKPTEPTETTAPSDPAQG